jgi:hypothetical protein
MRRKLTFPERASIADDTPLRLDVAAALAFPDGSMAASGLRREASKGRLAIERIAGKDYTTLASITEMRGKCRVEARVPVYGYNQPNEIEMGRSSNRQHGASATADTSTALAAAKATLKALKTRSAITSPENTKRPEPGTVIPLPSKSLT